MTILGWYEHLPSDDMPPRWMWHLDEEISHHFDEVKERYRTGASKDEDDWAAGPTIKNEYAKGRGRS